MNLSDEGIRRGNILATIKTCKFNRMATVMEDSTYLEDGN
jgi:hypothetical protein